MAYLSFAGGWTSQSCDEQGRGFTRAGGHAALHLFPAFDGDGHRLVDRVEIWTAAAAEFLRRLGLASP